MQVVKLIQHKIYLQTQTHALRQTQMRTTLKTICSMQADIPLRRIPRIPRLPYTLYNTRFIFLHPAPALDCSLALFVALQKFNKRCSIVRMPIISRSPLALVAHAHAYTYTSFPAASSVVFRSSSPLRPLALSCNASSI